MILDLSDGEMYIFAKTDTVISYDWNCSDEYIVIVYSFSNDLWKMITTSNEDDYNKKNKIFDDLASYKYAGPNDNIDEVQKLLFWDDKLNIHEEKTNKKNTIKNGKLKIKTKEE